jgi:hypothetical protein
MAIEYGNEIRVYGNRKNLDQFKVDMVGDRENGPISFQNIIPEPRDTSNYKDEYGSGSVNWKKQNWGCPWDADGAEMNDEGEFLVYSFGTRWSEPDGIYDKIIQKYSELDFEIRDSNDCNFGVHECTSIKGKITKNLYFYWEWITWRDGKNKDILYRKDLLKDTLKVVEEHIFYPGEYDVGTHTWHTKVVEVSEDNGIIRYEGIPSKQNLRLIPKISFPRPVDGRCMSCGRRISELRYFSEAGDPMEDNSERALFISVYRPIGLPVEEDKKALDKANRVYKSEGYNYQNDQLDRMQEEYGDTPLLGEAKEIWECRDCAVFTTDEYLEKLKERHTEEY